MLLLLLVFFLCYLLLPDDKTIKLISIGKSPNIHHHILNGLTQIRMAKCCTHRFLIGTHRRRIHAVLRIYWINIPTNRQNNQPHTISIIIIILECRLFGNNGRMNTQISPNLRYYSKSNKFYSFLYKCSQKGSIRLMQSRNPSAKMAGNSNAQAVPDTRRANVDDNMMIRWLSIVKLWRRLAAMVVPSSNFYNI